MTAPRPRRGTALLWTGLAALVGVGAFALWFTLGERSGEPPAAARRSAAAGASDTAGPRQPETATPAPVRAPAQRIADRGHLRVTREALREGDVLAIGLDMPDEARGEGPRPIKIGDISGRVIEVTAVPVQGAGSGMRLEIDPEWLRPGTYMIQVRTAERSPLPLRRYVLEVVEPGSAPD